MWKEFSRGSEREHIETKVICLRDVERMSDLLNHYFSALEDLGNPDSDVELEKRRKNALQQNILIRFGDEVKTFIHPTIGTVSIDEALSTKLGIAKKIPVKVRFEIYIFACVTSRNIIIFFLL